MKLGLNSAALRRVSQALRLGQAAEEQGLDWRDLQDLSSEITAAVQKQDLRRLMEAVEDMTSLMLSHIQMPAETDVSGAFPREESYVEFVDRPASRRGGR
jgi:hypothetical protein